MDVKQYLERIKYTGPLSPTIEVLSELQLMHLMNVPFENLDIHNKIKIDLKNLFHKIVTRRRGGFCYELNGLFYELLQEAGFTVKMVPARVHTSEDGYSPEFDHMAIVALIKDDSYLVDVGFGEFALSPLKIGPGEETTDPRGILRLKYLMKPIGPLKKRPQKASS